MSSTYQETAYTCGHTQRTLIRRDAGNAPDSTQQVFATARCPDCLQTALARATKRQERKKRFRQIFTNDA